MKKILFIATGGTIACTPTENGLAPTLTASDLLAQLHAPLPCPVIPEDIFCMDSSNMHIASMVGIPVVSIWGATHPYAGFMGWKQNESNAIQVDLPCRPCSIFGNKPCFRNDYACLQSITPKMIVEHIEEVLP